MTPKIRLKGPKRMNNFVTIATEYYSGNDDQNAHKVNVKINLDPKILYGIEKSTLKGQNSRRGLFSSQKSNKDSDISGEKEENPESADEIEEISDSDLSSLDFEINEALQSDVSGQKQSNMVLNMQNSSANAAESVKVKIETSVKQEFKPNDVKTEKIEKEDTTYKPIPPNILPLLRKELGSLSLDDDTFTAIEKIVFSLRDPLSACKIKLPVKSNYCPHFECFDFETFCIFKNIPPGVQLFTKKELIKRRMTRFSLPGKETMASPITIIDDDEKKPVSNKKKNVQTKAPTYSCPLCDTKFPLSELNISDSFNYFIKISSEDTTRIELWDMSKYRILESSTSAIPQSNYDNEEIIILTDDEDDHENTNANENTIEETHNTGKGPGHNVQAPFNHLLDDFSYLDDIFNSQMTNNDDIFEDGLDEELIRLSEGNGLSKQSDHGSGSWDDPVTLD